MSDYSDYFRVLEEKKNHLTLNNATAPPITAEDETELKKNNNNSSGLLRVGAFDCVSYSCTQLCDNDKDHLVALTCSHVKHFFCLMKDGLSTLEDCKLCKKTSWKEKGNNKMLSSSSSISKSKTSPDEKINPHFQKILDLAQKHLHNRFMELHEIKKRKRLTGESIDKDKLMALYNNMGSSVILSGVKTMLKKPDQSFYERNLQETPEKFLNALLDAGFDTRELHDVCGIKSLKDLSAAGFTTENLIEHFGNPEVFPLFCDLFSVSWEDLNSQLHMGLVDLSEMKPESLVLNALGLSVDSLIPLVSKTRQIFELFDYPLEEWVGFLGLRKQHLLGVCGLKRQDFVTLNWKEEEIKKIFAPSPDECQKIGLNAVGLTTTAPQGTPAAIKQQMAISDSTEKAMLEALKKGKIY